MQIITYIILENIHSLPPYDKGKYKEMILDATETVLGIFLALREPLTAISNFLRKGRKKWYKELKEQRARDIETEML